MTQWQNILLNVALAGTFWWGVVTIRTTLWPRARYFNYRVTHCHEIWWFKIILITSELWATVFETPGALNDFQKSFSYFVPLWCSVEKPRTSLQKLDLHILWKCKTSIKTELGVVCHLRSGWLCTTATKQSHHLSPPQSFFHFTKQTPVASQTAVSAIVAYHTKLIITPCNNQHQQKGFWYT